MADSGTYDQATLLRRQKIADAMLQGALEPQKITHWAQGVAQMARAGMGGYLSGQSDRDIQAAKDKETADLYGALGLPAPASKAPESGPLDRLSAMFGGGPAASPTPTAPAAQPQPTPPPSPALPAQPAAAPITADASQPRGFRNMNPGNIEDGPFARSQPGYVGSDGRFAKFASMDAGTGAMNRLLDSYAGKGINTVNGIINRWAPTSDGNNVSAYASDVAKRVGIDPNAPITPEQRPAVIAAMAQHENGRPLPNANPIAAALSTSSPAAPGAPAEGGLLAGVDPSRKAQIAALLASSNPTAKSIGTALLSQSIKPTEYEFKTAGDTLYRANPRTGTVEPVKDVGRGVKPMTDEQRREWKVPEGVAAGIDDNGKPVFSQPSAVNTVSPVVSGINERFDAQMKAAQGAPRVISSIHEARAALDSGAITGAGADEKLFLSKVGTAFGLPSDKVANTEVARAALGAQVLESAKSLGANPSNADRDYIEKVKGGSIKLDEASMRRLLDMQEKWARDTIKTANENGKKLIATDPEKLGRFAPMLSVEEPAEYVKAAGTAQPGSAPGASTPRVTKTIGGKTYYQENGQWYEQ